MEKTLKRRLHIATSWASSRIALLDSNERYEDSYAITQEFCEWINGLNSQNTYQDSCVLKVPNSINSLENQAKETDELLEL